MGATRFFIVGICLTRPYTSQIVRKLHSHIQPRILWHRKKQCLGFMKEKVITRTLHSDYRVLRFVYIKQIWDKRIGRRIGAGGGEGWEGG